ncbi:MAG: hypothetical protein M3O30_06955 [Planctomycetota bacterium]|nr:hypothetical protein [Planctomycetota bacterium]
MPLIAVRVVILPSFNVAARDVESNATGIVFDKNNAGFVEPLDDWLELVAMEPHPFLCAMMAIISAYLDAIRVALILQVLTTMICPGDLRSFRLFLVCDKNLFANLLGIGFHAMTPLSDNRNI